MRNPAAARVISPDATLNDQGSRPLFQGAPHPVVAALRDGLRHGTLQGSKIASDVRQTFFQNRLE